jgi:hypothetical protein
MKVDISEVFFMKEALKTVNIKATDAPAVAALISKLDKEFSRLEKIEEKKQEAEVVAK